MIGLVILFFAIVIHEYAHAWTANKLGDPTAKLLGRLTLNPIKHVDLLGTIIVPGILLLLRYLGMGSFVIGWAKPVPVNFLRLNNPRRDMILVAIAGPAINVAAAIVLSLILRLHLPFVSDYLILAVIFINLLLAVFNMIPIPPLDGSRVVMGLLPVKLARIYGRLERFGLLIVIVAMMYLGLFEKVVLPVTEILGRLLGVSFMEAFFR